MSVKAYEEKAGASGKPQTAGAEARPGTPEAGVAAASPKKPEKPETAGASGVPGVAERPLVWMDAHLHVDLYDEDERGPLLERAFAHGVAHVVAVSMDLASCMRNAELARRYPGRVHPAYGWHPEQPLPDAETEERLFAWIRARHNAGEPFAIGEVGLPYYTRTEAEGGGRRFDEAPYIRLLDRFAALAAELDRPIALHAVYEDADKACALLERHGVRRAHFHWFKGSDETIALLAARRFYISVTPDVEYEPDIRELVRRYPLELIMTETDGPWPFEGSMAGRKTRPEMTADVVRHIAAIKGLSAEETAAALLRNGRRFYGLEGADG
ncbi:DNAase [Paenibacillus sp. 32O-W]|uniref:TatD family hydrolase n=1 Tax=Paenibacillus sp. 32O-W TaxID=1695218 RepID=UPI00071FB71C|nr:DNAase [Paenibacillus sp. 32O-W]